MTPGPNFLVAGAARAGTTALIEGLRLHPEVFVTQPKEPHYFAYHGAPVHFTGPGDDEWVNRVVVTDRASYLQLFRGADDTAARGDGSVTTLYLAERAIPEILRINSEMRIVVVLREPVDRAFSSFAYLRLRGFEVETDFRRALAHEEQRRRAGWHHMWHYKAMSTYSEALRALVSNLGKDQVGIWFYDDLQSDYARVMGEIVEFLGVAPYLRPPTLPRVNASGTARSDLAQRTVRWATSRPRVRAALKHTIGFRTRERIRSSILRREQLDPEIRAEVAPLFADDLAVLASLLPGNLPAWLVPQASA